MERTYGHTRDFANVDASEHASEMVSYLDDVSKIAAEGKRQSYAALELKPGMSVLDVGCGTGEDVRALAEIVGARGFSAGVDSSKTMIDQAIERGVPANVRFEQAPASALPFEDARFDAARSERVFQHLEDPAAAAREIFRVLKPGGVVMLMDQDWESLIVAGSQMQLTRRILNAFVDRMTNGWAGRRHLALLKQSGFSDVTVQPMPLMLPFPAAVALVLQSAVTYAVKSGEATAHDGAQWLADLQMADERGEFLCAFTFFVAIARRPA